MSAPLWFGAPAAVMIGVAMVLRQPSSAAGVYARPVQRWNVARAVGASGNGRVSSGFVALGPPLHAASTTAKSHRSIPSSLQQASRVQSAIDGSLAVSR
jgi:hypothetical protein